MVASFDWKWQYTVFLFIVKVLGNILGRSILYFNASLSLLLGVTIDEFGIVNVAQEIGMFMGVFVGIVNEKYINNSQKILQIYAFIAGIMSLLFSLPFVFSNDLNHDLSKFSKLGYLAVTWFVFGIASIIVDTSVIHIPSLYINVSHNNNNSVLPKEARVVPILSSSVTVSTLFCVVMGYSIEYLPASLFITLGILIIIVPFCGFNCIFVKLLSASIDFSLNCNSHATSTNQNDQIEFTDNQNCETTNGNPATVPTKNEEKNDNEEKNNSWKYIIGLNWFLKNEKCTMLLLSVFATSVANGSAIITTNPTYMDIFNLSTHMSGVYSLSIFIGELMAAILLAKYTHKWTNFFFATISLSLRLIVTLLTLLLCILAIMINDNSKMHLFGLISIEILFFMYYFAWEIFYISSIMSMLKLANETKTPQRMLLLMTNTFSSMGRIIGIVSSTFLWEMTDKYHHWQSLFYVSLLWIIATIVSIIFYIKFYQSHGLQFQIKQLSSSLRSISFSSLQVATDEDDDTNGNTDGDQDINKDRKHDAAVNDCQI